MQTYSKRGRLGRNQENILHQFRRIQSHSKYLNNFMTRMLKICMVIEKGEKEAGKVGKAMTSMNNLQDIKVRKFLARNSNLLIDFNFDAQMSCE